jgi:Flp pilus assembly pilin Flp
MIERMRSALLALQADDCGATALEYGLILAIISITVVGWATFVGTSISQFFVDAANGM